MVISVRQLKIKKYALAVTFASVLYALAVTFASVHSWKPLLLLLYRCCVTFTTGVPPVPVLCHFYHMWQSLGVFIQ
jgi:hypothetical protein